MAPLEAWYVPAEHLWQVVSPVETPYQPGAQDVHEDPVNKFDDWYWPRAQSSQLPGEIWRLPALHPLGLHAQYFWDLYPGSPNTFELHEIPPTEFLDLQVLPYPLQ